MERPLKSHLDPQLAGLDELICRQGIDVELVEKQKTEAETAVHERQAAIKNWTRYIVVGGESLCPSIWLILRQVANQAWNLRTEWWRKARAQICVQASIGFTVCVSKRNFDGRLRFNHVQGSLGVDVSVRGEQYYLHQVTTPNAVTQTHVAAPSQGGHPTRAPKNLSGGERSFTLVSLLISLWDTVPSPIRCLDEWDVFLDHVNRGIAGKMLVREAQTEDYEAEKFRLKRLMHPPRSSSS